MLNTRGNAFVTIVLIAAIILLIFFIYYSTSTNDSLDNGLSNMGLTGNKDNSSESVLANDLNNNKLNGYEIDNNIELNATLLGIKELLIKSDQNISFDGTVNVQCDQKSMSLINPIFEGFKGTIDFNAPSVSGEVKTIKVDDNILWVNCVVVAKDFKGAQIEEYFGLIEKNKIAGEIRTKDVTKELENAFVKIDDYLGTLNISQNKLVLDGIASNVQIIQKETNIFLN